jgi:membrane associated rhomboid family serine protease
MVIPIGDEPNPRGVPWVTYLLIVANVAVYVFISLPLSTTPVDPRDPMFAAYVEAVSRSISDPRVLRQALGQVTAYDLYVFEHGFRPADMSIIDLFTSMFLHGGLLHLAGNMLFLWIYGDNVEQQLGRIRHLLAYLGTGAAAVLAHVLMDRSSTLPVVGASGAISGVLGFYFVWFPRNRVRLLWVLPPFFMDVFVVPARLVLTFYLLLDNLLPLLVGGGMGGVAHAAHIGGFIAGTAVAYLADRAGERRRPHDIGRSREPASIDAVRALLADGREGDAARAYFALPPSVARGALDPEDSLRLARRLHEQGAPEAALTMLRRHLRSFPDGPAAAEAHARAGTILLHDMHESTAAYQHFQAALDADPPPHVAALVGQGLEEIARLQKRRLDRRTRFA